MTAPAYRPDTTGPLEELHHLLRSLSLSSSHSMAHLSLRRSLDAYLAMGTDDFQRLTFASEFLPESLRAHFEAAPPSPTDVERRLATRAARWLSTMSEMLQRFAIDLPEIRERFTLSRDSLLDGVSEPLGDLHGGGRCVYRLQLTNERSVIYKPRSVQTEETFFRVLDFMREEGCEPALRGCRAFSRTHHGWTDYVPSRPCINKEEAIRFYWRQGGFLALFWLLCGDDATSDNVVVSGEQPFWIDTESICRPEIACAHAHRSALPDWIKHSVLTTGMVFFGKMKTLSPRHLTGLHVSCASLRAHVFSSQDVLHDVYLDAVVRGFRDVYVWLLQRRESVTADDGILNWWRSHPIRLLLRPTMMYAALISLSTSTPSQERSSLHRRIVDALVAGEGSNGAAGPWPLAVAEAEMTAMAGGDIPYWVTSTMSHDACERASGVEVAGLVSKSSMECLTTRAERMGEEDLAHQTWLLESFLGRRPFCRARTDRSTV